MNLKKTLTLVVLYFIVWFILGFVIDLLILNLYFHPFVAPKADQIQMLYMVRASQAISGFLILVYIFRKKLFRKKE